MTIATFEAPTKAGAAPAGQQASCDPGSGCDCAPAAKTMQHLSWPKTLLLTIAGGAICALLVKLLGA